MVGYGGIFLISASTNADKIFKLTRECFESLSYYGNEGYGLAIVESGSGLKIYRSMDINDVLSFGNDVEPDLTVGVCRYAIHGRPAIPNTPPFSDCSKRFIIVARGIFENIIDLRLKLLEHGHILEGKDPSEILVHLIEEDISKEGVSVEEALCAIHQTFRGVFSLILYDTKTNTGYVLARDLPEYIGTGQAIVVSSEPDVIVRDGLSLMRIENGVLRIHKGGVELIHGDVSELRIKLGRVVGGYDYHMEREMLEASLIIKGQRYAQQKEYLTIIAKLIEKSGKLFMIGSGSSYNSALYGGYIINELCEMQPIVQNATEFIYFHLNKIAPGDLIIANSQSGRTQDVMRAVTKSRMRGAIIVGIINHLGTPLMYASNVYLHIAAGIEVAIPATKTFIAQLTTFARLAIELSNIPENEKIRLRKELDDLSMYANRTMKECRETIDMFAKKIYRFDDAFVLGRGASFSIAAEGALKLKEVAHIHAEGLDVGEFRHGTKTFVRIGYPIVFLIPQDLEAREDTYDLVNEVREFVDLLIITDESDPFADRFSDFVVRVPRISEIFIPILYAIPLQYLAFRLGVLRGKPIDYPPKLSKYVARERSATSKKR